MSYPRTIKSLLIVVVVICLFILSRVVFASQWVRVYGSENWSGEAQTVQKTSDGGYVLAGWGPVIKLDRDYQIQWKTGFAGKTIEQTSDGGYILGGNVLVTPNGQSMAFPAFPQPLQNGILMSKLDESGALE